MALTSGEAPLTIESQGKCRLRLVGDGKEMDVPFLGCINLRDDYQLMDSPTIVKNKEANAEYEVIANQVLSSLTNK